MSVIKHTRRNVNRDITLCVKSAYLNTKPDNTSFKCRDKLFCTQKHADTKIKPTAICMNFIFPLKRETDVLNKYK